MRLLRWILLALATVSVAAALIIAAGTAWLNTFIHSDSFRHEVEQRAGKSLGGTVQIESIDFDFFHGIELKGLVTRLEPRHATLQVEIERVNCAYAWKELFHRKLKLTGVTLDRPQLILTPQPPAPPLPPETITSSPAAVPSPGPIAPSVATPPPPVSTVENPAPAPKSNPIPFQFVLEHANLKDGLFSVRDAAGHPMVDLSGIQVEARTGGDDTGQDITGRVQVADVALPSNLHLTDFSVPVVYQAGSMVAKPLKASAFGGRIAGEYQLGTMGPSMLDLNAKSLDVAQMTASGTARVPVRVTGLLDLQSKWRGIETGEINGEGDAQLTDGKVGGVKLLEDLSQILQVKELHEPIITRAQVHFLVQNKQAQFIGLQLESPIFHLTGDGSIGFDGQVQASLVLVLKRDAMRRLPQEAAASFVLQPDGTGSIAFTVSGTTSKPNTDLGTRLLMQNTQIQNVIDKALKKFFK